MAHSKMVLKKDQGLVNVIKEIDGMVSLVWRIGMDEFYFINNTSHEWANYLPMLDH